MGTRMTKIRIKASLLPPNIAKFSWASNDTLAMRSKYHTDMDLDRLSPLAVDEPGDDEEWALRPIGVGERVCSPSAEGQFIEYAKFVMYEVVLNEVDVRTTFMLFESNLL